jgi:hypothetical protein
MPCHAIDRGQMFAQQLDLRMRVNGIEHELVGKARASRCSTCCASIST